MPDDDQLKIFFIFVQVLHLVAFAVITWNCVAYSYTIRNMYKRMPVDRSSQGLAQVMLEKNAKVSPVKSAKARQTSEPAGIPISPTLIVKGVRNDLSNLGGALIGGFSEVTGLKLKKKPGFDLPILASLNLGMYNISKNYDTLYRMIIHQTFTYQSSFMIINISQDPKVSKKLEMTKQN